MQINIINGTQIISEINSPHIHYYISRHICADSTNPASALIKEHTAQAGGASALLH